MSVNLQRGVTGKDLAIAAGLFEQVVDEFGCLVQLERVKLDSKVGKFAEDAAEPGQLFRSYGCDEG